jgi:DNA polymerase-3 subunit epsilon
MAAPRMQLFAGTLPAEATRVLTLIALPPTRPLSPGAKRVQACLLDVQTTGLDARSDAVIELVALPVVLDSCTGHVVEIGEPIGGMRHPGRDLPALIEHRTGLTNRMLAGQRLPLGPLAACIGQAQLIIAFHAAFDRAFAGADAILPAVNAGAVWACAKRDVPWAERGGYRAESLDALLAAHARHFLPDTARSTEHCVATLALLQHPFADGSLPMAHLLHAVRQKEWLFVVRNTPTESNQLLKERGYQWFPGDATRAEPINRYKGWYVVVPDDVKELEWAWIRATLYADETKYKSHWNAQNILRPLERSRRYVAWG